MPITLFDFSQAISKLNKDKRYGDALKYFKENKAAFQPEEIGKNGYVISAMLSALRHTNNIEVAFKFLELYKVKIDGETKEIVLSSYGWLLYDKYKSENSHIDNHEVETEVYEDEMMDLIENQNVSKSDTVKLIEQFIPLILKYDSVYAYTVLSRLFNQIPKIEKKKANANWKLILEFCDLVPPERLKTDCESIEVERKGKRVMMELASDKENWYAYKSKALMKLGMFQECYDVSKQALDLFPKFHYSNDVWFARRIALSKKQLGDSENVISELQQILKRKREWFIEKELAELYREKGDLENALKFALSAINNFGDLEYKVDLLFLIGELLKMKQQDELAFKHFSLSRLVRINEEWSVPSKLNSALESFGKASIPIEAFPELKKELTKYWNGFKEQQTVRGQPNKSSKQKTAGKIHKILHNDERGADGFIRCNDGKSVYFRVNSTEEIKNGLTVGMEVEFLILPPTEDKKEKAIQLRPI